MKETKIIFTLNEVNTAIKCSKDDKIDDICLRYAMEINKNKDNLIFLYEGKKINSDLKFKEHANIIDKNNSEMKISVYEKENHLICHECWEKLKFNKESINEMILCNNKIKNIIKEIKLQINTLIENSLISSNKIILYNINIMLISIVEDILNNNEKLINLFDNNNDIINDIMPFNNNYDNENNLKNKLEIKSDETNGKEDSSNTNNIIENCTNLNEKKLYEKIKSKLINKIIFSNIHERIKLKTIKYNKKLQKKLNINLINYKHFLGKYIIYETKNKGKEYGYSNDNLLFYGEYINGERHGKGEQYTKDGKLDFEGEYLNGKRNGFGKDYYDNRKIYYEGEYLNNEKNGYGKEYYIDGKLKFEGEYKNDSMWNGKMYDKNNNLVAELTDGKGLIKQYNKDGQLILEGEYFNGKMNGKGLEYYKDGKLKFEGEFKDGKRWNGKGYNMSNKIIYELKNGEGTVEEYDDNDNLMFKCEFKNGEKNGNGIEYNNGKFIFEGEYKNGKRNGKGKEYDDDRLKFEGEYLNGERNGKGKEYDENGDLRFEGYYLYFYKLRGKEYFEGRLEYEGEYLYGIKWEGKGYDEDGNIIYELNNGNGKVKEYYETGKLKFEGEYIKGKKNGREKNIKMINVFFMVNI